MTWQVNSRSAGIGIKNQTLEIFKLKPHYCDKLTSKNTSQLS